MTKKHYIKIAAVFREQVEQHPITAVERMTLYNVLRELTPILQDDNPAFDKARFMAACGF